MSLELGDKRAILSTQTLGYIADFRASFACAAVGVDGGRCLVDAMVG